MSGEEEHPAGQRRFRRDGGVHEEVGRDGGQRLVACPRVLRLVARIVGLTPGRAVPLGSGDAVCQTASEAAPRTDEHSEAQPC